MTQGLGEAAANLPWLSPCAASLVALARAPTPTAWDAVRSDPGCVLLLLRHGLPPGAASGLSFFPALLRDPAPLEAALRHLAQPGPGFVDWDQPLFRPVYDACLLYARAAYLLADKIDLCAPDNAWVAGLLAPLGWLAACAIADCGLRIADWKSGPSGSDAGRAAFQSAIRNPQSAIGFDPAAVARRLNRLWHLPPWLAAVTGHLGLPVAIARDLGADPSLFRVVQLAVSLASDQGAGLSLAVGAAVELLSAELGLTVAELQEVKQALAEKPRPLRWEPPASLPLLPDLLRLGTENRRLLDGPSPEALQQDIDALQRAVQSQRAGEAERLRTLKLAALAELAAGAGHEINNPLAVISGQAQYLLVREADPQRQHSLQTIVNQAKRIHQMLTELMQFARPPVLKRQAVDVGGLLRQVAEGLRDLAEQRQVRLGVTEPAAPLTLDADPNQAQVALRCLLRNAIEAAPPEGWASAHAEECGAAVELVVEDSGTGPSAAEREHLFDPFYSGRKAGRGRGLGLSTAWRLAREHGGDVRFDACTQGPTRFTLRLPRSHARPPEPGLEPVSQPALAAQPVLEAPAVSTLEADAHAPGRNGSNSCQLTPPATST